MELHLTEVRQAIEMLRNARGRLVAGRFAAVQSGRLAYSLVSGLDASGAFHGSVRSVNEPEAMRGLAQHLEIAASLLESQLAGYVGTDALNGALLDSVMGETLRSVGGVMGEAVSVDPPVVNPFGEMPMHVGVPASLEVLALQLAATDVGAMSAIASDWAQTSATVIEAITHVPMAITLLGSSTETVSIQRAVDRLTALISTANKFGVRAGLMGQHSSNLVALTEANQIQAAAALATARAAANPAATAVIEREYLRSFAPKLTAELAAVKPAFQHLLHDIDSPNGAPLDVAGPAAAAATQFQDAPLPKPIQDALVKAGYGDLAHAQTPTQVIEQFGRPNPEMLEHIAAGASPTQVASAAAPSLPPVTAGGPSFAGVPSVGAAGGAGAPLGAAPGGLGAGAAAGAGAGLGAGGVGAYGAPVGAGANGFQGASSGRGGSGARAAVMPGTGFGAGAGGSRLGGAGGFGGSGAGGGGPLGAGAGSGGGAGAAPGATNVVAGGPGAAQGSGSRGGVAGAPLGQRNHGGGARRKKGKVQAVTSAVEREGNLKALLGEAPEVVPGVIGAWVREPRR